MSNDALNLPILEKAAVVGYTDGIAMIVVAKHLESGELYSCEAISTVKVW